MVYWISRLRHQYTWVRSRGTTIVVEEKLDKILITDYLKELRLLWLRAHIVIICQSYLHQWWLCNTLAVNGSVLITYGFVKMFVVKLLSKAGLLLWGWAFMRGWRCVARIFGGGGVITIRISKKELKGAKICWMFYGSVEILAACLSMLVLRRNSLFCWNSSIHFENKEQIKGALGDRGSINIFGISLAGM